MLPPDANEIPRLGFFTPGGNFGGGVEKSGVWEGEDAEVDEGEDVEGGEGDEASFVLDAACDGEDTEEAIVDVALSV